MWDDIAKAISEATGRPFRATDHRPIGGGSINDAYALMGDDERYFVKLNDAAHGDMFEAEAEGLQEMLKADAVACPEPITWGTSGGQAFIVLTYLDLGGRGSGQAMGTFGRQLAAMHRFTQARFGWHRDNTIGSTPQPNSPDSDWVSFWRRQRLGFQLELAARNGYSGGLQRDGDQLMDRLGAFFETYQPAASLLHGDLWSGNYAIAADGQPVIFDPAVYYGDREADLAMTELFGSFGGDFYAAYDEAWPMDPGYRVRKTLYNLYHMLNHLNLFGSGYRGQCERMLGQLLSEAR